LYRRVTGVDIRTLPLRPEEVFVLSRVDGQSDTGAIAVATGIAPTRVAEHLRRLEELGTVRRTAPATTTQMHRSPSQAPRSPSQAPHSPSQFPRSPSQAPRAPSLAPPAPSQFPRSPSQAPRPTPMAARPSSPAPRTPVGAARPPPATPAPASAPSHPEIDQSLSISVELQARILDLSARLAELDHFELLGVPREAERATIKRAYFTMIGTFHPDTYFGKRLGAFTKRMEKIFQRLTEAHDILSNRKSREEYEGYLTALGRTRGLDPSSHPPASVQDLERLLLQAERAAKQAAPPSPPPAKPAPVPARRTPPAAAPPPKASPTAARPALKPPPLPQAPRTPSHRPVQLVDDPVARRQALARKFGRTNLNSSPPAAPEPEKIETRAARQSAAARELHQRYQHRKTAIRDQRIERFAKAAEEAIASGNNVSALNTLKIARTLSGGDVAVVARIEELEKQLGSTVADSYLQRARYEESNGHYAEAARSYTRAARGQLNAEVLRSAAECYLKAGVELRLAGDLAKEAVQLAPNRSDLRLTLAKIYEAAGMPQSAVRELERAIELSPDSERIKQWLKRLQRGGV
jgi:tetratricopeptide (TPR) repeat protein